MRLRRLVYMDLGRNQFSGTLPSDIGEKYVVLRHLYLDHNNFVGSIPTTFPAIGNDRLESLALDDNQLTGVVPGGHEILNHLGTCAITGYNRLTLMYWLLTPFVAERSYPDAYLLIIVCSSTLSAIYSWR